MNGGAAIIASGSSRPSEHPGQGFLDIRGVSKTYLGARGQSVQALDDISLTIAEGQIVALLGPSGCGKSTLLRLIAALDSQFTGTISWQRPPRRGKDIGFVFQDAALLPWRNVARNIALGLEVQRVDKKRIAMRVEELLDLVGLSEFAKSFPRELRAACANLSIARSPA